jgi:chromatin structure-remodeling complex subunit SFH1
MPPSYRPQPQAAAAVSHRPQVYQHPPTYEAGPLPYFLPPPGQTTTDPTLSRPPVTQSYHSTYPSRLRTGVSGLIQPEVITGGPKEREYFLAELDREIAAVQSGSGASTPRFDSPAPFSRKQTTTTTFSGRRGRVVNYAEKESEDEDEDDMSDIGEAPSDPEDMSYGERRKRATSALDRSAGGEKLRREAERMAQSMGGPGGGPVDVQAAMRAGRLRKKREEMERGWTWLGDRAPGDRVRSIRARPTRHQYVYVAFGEPIQFLTDLSQVRGAPREGSGQAGSVNTHLHRSRHSVRQHRSARHQGQGPLPVEYEWYVPTTIERP